MQHGQSLDNLTARRLSGLGRVKTMATKAQTGEYGDMIAFSILDQTKVTRSALQNAASIAGLMITSDAIVAELPTM